MKFPKAFAAFLLAFAISASVLTVSASAFAASPINDTDNLASETSTIGFDFVDTYTGVQEYSALALSANQPDQIKAIIRTALRNCDSTVGFDYTKFNMSTGEYKQIFSSLMFEPEFFYVEPSIDCSYFTNGPYAGRVTLGRFYYTCTKAELPNNKLKVERAINDALSWVPKTASADKKLQAVHDWIVRKTQYDKIVAGGGTNPDKTIFTSYGVFVNRNAVCQGYALAFKTLAIRLGFECIMVPSEAMNHAWNMVRIDNAWYHVDATWDDPTPDRGFNFVSHTYFLLGDAYITSPGNHHSWTSAYTAPKNFYPADYNSYPIYNAAQSDPIVLSSTVQANVSADEKTVTITAFGGDFENALSVSFPTWSDAGGQDDLRWYGAARNAYGFWTLTIPISNHRTAGTYQVHAYGMMGGRNTYIAATTFRIAAPSGSVSASQTDAQKENGTFTLTYTPGSQAENPSGLQAVSLPTWSQAGGQDDLVWYAARQNAQGKWVAENIPCVGRNRSPGAYVTHPYVTTGNGIFANTGGITYNTELTPASLTATVSADEKTATIKAKGGLFAYASSVSFPTWSDAGGQDDLRWYGANRGADGFWTITVPISNHRTAGTYQVHAYVGAFGTSKFAGVATFSISRPTGSIFATQTDAQKESGTFTLTYVPGSQAENPSGMSAVSLPTWSEAGGQDDLVWYTARQNAQGKWVAENIPCVGRNRSPGAYVTHPYVTTGNGIFANTGGLTYTTELTPASLTATVSADEKTATIKAKGGLFAYASSVSFPTWSDAGGQDDLHWYAANRGADGFWTITFPISNHRTAGTYQVHAYVGAFGVSKFAGVATFTISRPTGSIFATQTDAQKESGTFTLTYVPGSQAENPSGMSAVSLPTWSEAGGQDDLVWYAARQNAAGKWVVENIPCLTRNRLPGTYITHPYVTTGNGIFTNTGGLTYTTSLAPTTLTATVSADEKSVTLKAKGGLFAHATSVSFPTWSDYRGQDDLRWYGASRASDGFWTFIVPISNHKSTGAYQVHAYVSVLGRSAFAAATTFIITGNPSPVTPPQPPTPPQPDQPTYPQPLNLTVTNTALKCNTPVTFTLTPQGGTGPAATTVTYTDGAGKTYTNAPRFKYAMNSLTNSLINSAEMPFNNCEMDPSAILNSEGKKGYQAANTFQFTFVANGTYTIKFSVMDFGGQPFATKQITHTVTVNDPAATTIEAKYAQIEAATRARNFTTDYDKALFIHDTIINNAEYDNSLQYTSPMGVLLRGKGTCESYFAAFNTLLKRFGIETERASGNGHVWSRVKLDGVWTNVDITWDDPSALPAGREYKNHMYFGITDEMMKLVHSDHQPSAAHPATSTAVNYFMRSGEISKWYNAAKTQIGSAAAAETGGASGELRTREITAEQALYPETYYIIYPMVAEKLAAEKPTSWGWQVTAAEYVKDYNSATGLWSQGKFRVTLTKR